MTGPDSARPDLLAHTARPVCTRGLGPPRPDLLTARSGPARPGSTTRPGPALSHTRLGLARPGPRPVCTRHDLFVHAVQPDWLAPASTCAHFHSMYPHFAFMDRIVRQLRLRRSSSSQPRARASYLFVQTAERPCTSGHWLRVVLIFVSAWCGSAWRGPSDPISGRDGKWEFVNEQSPMNRLSLSALGPILIYLFL